MFCPGYKKAIVSAEDGLGVVVDLKEMIKNFDTQKIEELIKQIQAFDGFSLNKEYWSCVFHANEKDILVFLDNKSIAQGYIIYSKEKEDEVQLEKISTNQTDDIKGRGTLLMRSLLEFLDNTETKRINWYAADVFSNYGPTSFYHKSLDRLKALGCRYEVDICDRTEQRIFVLYLNE